MLPGKSDIMKITITCYARFRDIFGDETAIELPEPATIHDAIRTLAKQAGPDSEIILTSDGMIKGYVMIMHRDERIFPKDAMNIPLTDGDKIILFPPVSGG